MSAEPERGKEKGEMERDIALRLPAELPGLGEEISEVSEASERAIARAELVRELSTTSTTSAMLSQFGFVVRGVSALLFTHVHFETRTTDAIRDAARRGPIVYVMQSRSLLDYLYFNWSFRNHGLPLAAFANGIRTAWLRGIFGWIASWFWRPKATSEEVFEALVEAKRPLFLFLEKPRQWGKSQSDFSQTYLFRLVRAQRRARHEEIIIVPLMLLWERRPDPRYISFLGELFGTPGAPGFFRKVFGVVQTLWQSFFNIGRPLVRTTGTFGLGTLLSEYPSAGSADGSELLRERLQTSFERERLIMLGPSAQPEHEVLKALMQRPEVLEKAREVAQEEGIKEEVARRRVRTFFRGDRGQSVDDRAQGLLSLLEPDLVQNL